MNLRLSARLHALMAEVLIYFLHPGLKGNGEASYR